jgi:cystathionine beta-lyase/cystathionine gamma-synthase
MAEFLATHPKVSSVLYPGLKTDPGHEVAAKQMHGGFGGVLAFDVGTSQEDAKRFISSLKVIVHAVSLGATESLICIPYLTTMLYLPEERRTTFGVHLNTVRLAAGIEEPDDLTEDLEQALAKV